MTPKPWSISALDQFVNCPKQYAEIKVFRRIRDHEGVDASYGNYCHEHFEQYLLARGSYALPTSNPEPIAGYPAPSTYRAYLDGLLRTPGEQYVEFKMALDRTRSVCDFWAQSAWVRGKADFIAIDGNVARAVDHKTGKPKVTRQMVLMALLTFYHFPQVDTVHTGFFWLRHKHRDVERFQRSDMKSMWNQFLADLWQWRDAHIKNEWQPRESGLCKGWCPVTDCEFWQPKRVRT